MESKSSKTSPEPFLLSKELNTKLSAMILVTPWPSSSLEKDSKPKNTKCSKDYHKKKSTKNSWDWRVSKLREFQNSTMTLPMLKFQLNSILPNNGQNVSSLSETNYNVDHAGLSQLPKLYLTDIVFKLEKNSSTFHHNIKSVVILETSDAKEDISPKPGIS